MLLHQKIDDPIVPEESKAVKLGIVKKDGELTSGQKLYAGVTGVANTGTVLSTVLATGATVAAFALAASNPVTATIAASIAVVSGINAIVSWVKTSNASQEKTKEENIEVEKGTAEGQAIVEKRAGSWSMCTKILAGIGVAAAAVGVVAATVASGGLALPAAIAISAGVAETVAVTGMAVGAATLTTATGMNAAGWSSTPNIRNDSGKGRG